MEAAIHKIRSWFHREVFLRSMTSGPALVFWAVLAILAGYMSYKGLSLIVMLVAGIFVGLIIVYLCLFKPYIGFFVVTFLAFFAFYPKHLLNRPVPLSTLVELLIWFVFLGSYREKRDPDSPPNTLLKSGVTIALIFYTSFHVIEFFNPNMDSKMGYLFIMRKFASFILIYIMTYRLINTPDKVRFFLKFWLFFSFLAGAYACYQQWFGYLPMELTYIKSDPTTYALMYQWGNLRKFSFLSDVVSFSVLAGIMCVLMIVIGINQKKKSRKYTMLICAFIMFLGMSYAGTRTATIIVPTGISLYLLMTIKNKSTLITLFSSFILILFFFFAPIYNPTIQRLRSTFNTNDASLNVRDANRHFIQPYIYAHPMGGGLATSGVQGRHYNPSHPLAGFPPDSGLLEVALEEGWLGLAVTILFYMTIMYQCIYYYFRIENPEYKVYCVGIAAVLLPFIVTQYSQVSIGQIPGIFFFMGSIGIAKRLYEFDRKEREEKEPASYNNNSINS